MLFWIKMYFDGAKFFYLILADLIHSLLLVDFAYIFFKHKGGDLITLTNI